MKQRHSIIPASYLVCLRDGEVLLARRYNTGYQDGKWSMPAGHVDKGETFTQCVIRETKEEIDITVSEKDIRVAHVLHRNSETNEEDERMDIFFVCERWNGEPKIMEPHKCDGLEWFPTSNLPEDTLPYIRHTIDMISKNISYSEFGWDEK